MTTRVFLLLLLTAMLWGGTPVIEKVALRTTDPLVGLTIRSVFISLVLLVVVILMGRWHVVMEVSLRDKMFFCLSGVMAGLLGMLTYYTALRISPASRAVPIAATYPLFSAVLGALLLSESFTPAKFAGTLLIIAGVWLVK